MTRKTRKATKPNSGNTASGTAAESSGKADQGPPQTREQKFADKIRTSAQRETVEAFVVAFVLALLFRAFVAEAFVIPTGSMAPTLMGAHKDIECDQCQHRFQIGASRERSNYSQFMSVVGGVCPNCRHINSLDLAGNANDATFNGDRILVSKFAYAISEPKRWDVIVFKYPGNPKQNYIKRLVGLPGETLSIQYGDVYAAPLGIDQPDRIVRKPADKLLAMRHHVYDSSEQSKLLIESGFPSRMQPWRAGATEPPTDSWQVKRDASGLVASLEDADANSENWLRYFHHWPSPFQWDLVSEGESLDDVDPYRSGLVTDFYAYDCYINVPYDDVYVQAPSNGKWSGGGRFSPRYQSGGPISQFGGRARFGDGDHADKGSHWVGDLIVESDVNLSDDCTELVLELIECGIRHQCRIDLKTGDATWVNLDGETRLPFTGPDGKPIESVKAATGVRAGDHFSVRFSNCDDELLLWIDNSLVEFDAPARFDARQFRSPEERYPRYQPGVHPLDASPIGIAVRGGNATIERVRVDRDKHYIATNRASEIYEYDMGDLYQRTMKSFSLRDIQEILASPDRWESSPIWQSRRRVAFELQQDQFFPMGDNSPESLDARCWVGAKPRERLPDRFGDQAYAFSDASYVPRDLLVGKALLVFWPHPWNTPVPFTPNFDRFRLIR